MLTLASARRVAGFTLNSPVSYSYVKKGEQKAIKQKKRVGRRLSILGLFTQGESLEYGLKLGGFKSKHYIEMLTRYARQPVGLNWQALKALKELKETGKITVIILDNYAVHPSAKK